MDGWTEGTTSVRGGRTEHSGLRGPLRFPWRYSKYGSRISHVKRNYPNQRHLTVNGAKGSLIRDG